MYLKKWKGKYIGVGEEYRQVASICMENVRNAEAQNKLRFARDVKKNKNKFSAMYRTTRRTRTQ